MTDQPTSYIPSHHTQHQDEKEVKDDAQAAKVLIADLLKQLNCHELPDKLLASPESVQKLEKLLIGYPEVANQLFDLEEKDLKALLKEKSEEEQQTRKKSKK